MSPIRKTTSIALIVFIILMPINLIFVIVNAIESDKVEIETFDGELTSALEEFYKVSFSGADALKKMECNLASRHAPLILTVTMTSQEVEALKSEYTALPIYQGTYKPSQGVVIKEPANNEALVTVTFYKELTENKGSLQVLGYLYEKSIEGNTILRTVVLSIWLPVNLAIVAGAILISYYERRHRKKKKPA